MATVTSAAQIPTEWIGRAVKIRRVQVLSSGREHVTEPVGILRAVDVDPAHRVCLVRVEIPGDAEIGPHLFSLDPAVFSTIEITRL